MTPPEPAPAPDDFALLTELRTSEEVWVERAAEAETLAGSIAGCPSPIVVLLGPARAGKSELLRRWVIPVLERNFKVSYRDSCESTEGENDSRAEIEFWDSFERCLTDAALASGELVLGLTRQMERRRKLVLCVADEFLSRLFQLCSVVPEIQGGMLQIPMLDGARVVQTLQQTASRHGINLGASFTAALAADLNVRRTTATIGAELVAVLVFQLERTLPKHRELLKEDYVAAGGLNGLLESYLDFVFERMPGDLDSPLGWSVIEDIVTTGNGAPLNLDDVARRFGVPHDAPWRVVRYLEELPRVLRLGGSDYSVVPIQIVTAIEGRMRRDALSSDPIRAALYQGARSFAVSQSLLSRQSFKRIHAQRTAIKVSDDEAALMLRCALAYEDSQSPGAIDYWLQRIIAGPARVEVLFDALFDADDGIRQRALKRLAGVEEPEIRNQVHLLALRDPSQDVRTAAVDVLGSFKDDDIKRSLLREIGESTSRFRLQAIEALRVFTDAEATRALVDITRKNAPDTDVDARLKAIEVLGVQNTPGATNALLDIGLNDTDADDRAGAANALASLTEEGLLAPVLERLRQLRRDAGRLPSSFSARTLALTAARTVLAALVVILSPYMLPLFVIKRWRLALLLLAGVVVGGLLSQSYETEGLGVLIGMTSLSLGLLIPTAALLRERLDFKPQSPFRRCLSAMLFAACAVTFFLFVHGLASMLARRPKRGLVLIGFEVLGALFLLIAAFFKSQFTGVMIGSSGLLFGSLQAIGWMVLAVSYLIGVGTVLLEVFVFRDRRVAVQRIDDMCRGLLQGPVVSGMVIQSLSSESRESARWGTELGSRFGEQMQHRLRQLWARADTATQKRIFSLLAKRRDAGTMEFLKKVAPTLGTDARLRAFRADLAFRFSVWPPPLLIAVALVLVALVTIPIGVVGMMRAHPDQLLKVVNGEESRGLLPWSASSPSEIERREAVNDLQRLALQSQDSRVAVAGATKLVEAATSLGSQDPLRGEILDAIGRIALGNRNHEVSEVTGKALAEMLKPDKQLSPEQRGSVLKAIVELASISEHPDELVKGVAPLLQQTETEREAIDTLRGIGTPEAALALASFARDRTEAVIGASATYQATDLADAAARRALDALKRVTECGEATVRLLTTLGTRVRSPSGGSDVPGRLLDEVARTATQLDPLSRAQYYLTEGRYDEAIDAGAVAVKRTPVTEARLLRAKEILQRAHLSRGTRLMEAGATQITRADEDNVRKDLDAAIAVGLKTVQTEIVNLGLRLAYQLHEFRSPVDPEAYRQVYEILTTIAPMAQGALSDTVQENLAEASMTTGHYDQAITMSQELAARTDLDASITLAMKYVQFAALILKGDRPRADAALADVNRFLDKLPPDFENTWSYAGTRRYIQREAPDSMKLLLETLARIESESGFKITNNQ